jgi:hypothetical protein
MSSISHLTVTPSSSTDTRVNKRHSSFNLPISSPCDNPTYALPSNTVSTTQPNYILCVRDEPVRKQSITVTHTLTPSNGLRKLSAISLPFPWHKRACSPTDDKSSNESVSKRVQSHSTFQTSNRMSRDRLLTLDRLLSSGTHTTSSDHDEQQLSPETESTALNESTRTVEKTIRSSKENGYIHNSAHILTR